MMPALMPHLQMRPEMHVGTCIVTQKRRPLHLNKFAGNLKAAQQVLKIPWLNLPLIKSQLL